MAGLFVQTPSSSCHLPDAGAGIGSLSAAFLGRLTSGDPRNIPQEGTVPLLYPGHFTAHTTHWPKPDLKKPNAIVHNAETHTWLYPNGWYCVVRRFSSKEEKRRTVASVVQPHRFPKVELLCFENHMNVFHEYKRGLPESLARGLAVFLSTTAVDETFRRFNGHTQVKATDLRRMKYPSRAALTALGEWAMDCGELSQAAIDEQVFHGGRVRKTSAETRHTAAANAAAAGADHPA